MTQPSASTADQLQGIIVPLVTPFRDDGEVDLASLGRLVDEAIAAGASSLLALGTTGEPATLSGEEQEQVIATVIARAKGSGVSVGVGAGTYSTSSTRVGVERAESLGADWTLIVSPYYLRPSAEGIAAHYRAVAEVARRPVVAYNIPYRTGREIPAGTLLQLAAEGTIAGVKQAVGGVEGSTLQLLRGQPFTVLCGDDPYIFPMMSLGAAGAIAASANIATDRYVQFATAAHEGDFERARVLHEQLLPLSQALFAEPSPGVIKGVLHAQGRIASPSVRLPMTPASSDANSHALACVPKG